MTTLLRKCTITALSLFGSMTMLLGQSEVIVMGKIDIPIIRNLELKFTENLFQLTPNQVETKLDADDYFAFKIKISEPRVCMLQYRNNKLRIFVKPGDTLKLRFDGRDFLKTVIFDGYSAAENQFLHTMMQKFPSLLDEKTFANARETMNAPDYLRYIDNLYKQKRVFFDETNENLKNNFSNEFLDFITNEINYWRAYNLIAYYKRWGVDNSEKMLDADFFNFLFETDNVYSKALNNDNYLKFLEIYLPYVKERDNRFKHNVKKEVVKEEIKSYKFLKPNNSSVRVLEDPFATFEIISWLTPNEEAYYENVQTLERFKYVGIDTSFEDVFLKIRTLDGKIGWVPESSVKIYEKTLTERKIYTRLCFDTKSPLCGFDEHLVGKVLYFALTKDAISSFIDATQEEIEQRISFLSASNKEYQEYNEILRETQKLTLDVRKNGIERVVIPPSFVAEKTALDAYYKAKINKIERIDPTKIDSIQKANANNAQANTRTEPVKTDNPSNNTQANARTEPVKTDNPSNNTQANTGTEPVKTDNPSNNAQANARTEPVKTDNPSNNAQANTATEPVKTDNPSNNAQANNSVTPPNNPTPSVPNTHTSPPVVHNAGGTSTVHFVQPAGNIEIDTTQDVIPARDLPNYDPNASAYIFKGLVIGETIPPFSLIDINGKEVRQQDLIGKVVVIDFWASWCGPCQAQMSHHKQLAEKYKDKNVEFVFISIDQDPEAWREFLKMQPLPGINGNDAMLLPINFQIQAIPNYFVIDKTGRVAYNSLIKTRINADTIITYLIK